MSDFLTREKPRLPDSSQRAQFERVVLPLYYGPKEGASSWINVMKGAISKNASYFNSYRMMRRYAAEAYLR